MKILRWFAFTTNTKELLDVDSKGGSRMPLIDSVRLTCIVAGVAGHCLSCLETIPGWYLIARNHDLKNRFGQIWAQPFMNEGGLGLVTFIGGFATFWGSYEVMLKGNFRFKMAVVDRWLRYAPSLMSMVAIDILWPLSGDGPMFTLVANHIAKKCSNNAWMNLLFLNNFKTAPENVSK